MNTLEHGLKLLEQYVYLPEPVNVLSQYYSFCPSSNSCDVDNVLGMAMPSTMIQLERSEFGLDPKFLYPPSLIKQYYPNDENITQIEYDIVSEFNSDYNWYFLGDEQDWGASHAVNGGFITMHEIIHGLGFLSSWELWDEQGFTGFMPSYPTYSNGTIDGMLYPFIFNKLLGDNLNNVWINVYSEAISQSLNHSFVTKSFFNQTIGYQISESLIQLFETPFSTSIWFPSCTTIRNALMFTPSLFSSGSTLSHVDNIYIGADYLMRPNAIGGVSFDKKIPSYHSAMFSDTLLGILRGLGYITPCIAK
ncbi:hypothetical protein HDV04_000162 [Boothiomyces sp. JEL0838]|nr:hypothetical protein HDV04_000162 [Boothiomyces sp. JEL0838]